MESALNRIRPRTSLRIAVADDELELRNFYGKILPRLGHELVAIAEDGEQLVRLCEQVPVDLIISDVLLPKMSGLDAVAEIRKWNNVAVVYVAGDHLEDLAAASAVEAVVLVKPFAISDLTPAISRALSRFRSSTQRFVTIESAAYPRRC